MAHLTYTAVYAVLEKDDQVYLMQRANSGYCDGMWGLPSGHLEENETLPQALIREVAEETGLTLYPQNITLAHTIFRMSKGRVYNDYFFQVKDWQGTPTIKEPSKCTVAGWYGYENMPAEMPPEVRHTLHALRTGGPQISQLDLRA